MGDVADNPGEPLLTELEPYILEAAGALGLAVDVVACAGAGAQRLWANERCARLLRRSLPDVLADDPMSELDPELAARLVLSREGSPTDVFETDLQRADGTRVPVQLAVRDVRMHGSVASVRCAKAQADQRAAAEALAASERRFRDLIEASPAFLAILAEGRVVYANRAATEMVGRQAILGLQGLSLADLVHPDDLSAVESSLGKAGYSAGPTSCRLRRKDGEAPAIQLQGVPIEWDDNPAVLLVGREADRRRHTEDAWAQADRLSAVGTLAAGVAHEINNPLAYVILNLQYLLRELPKLSQDRSRLRTLVDRYAEAQHGVARVCAIVRDLRDFSLPQPAVIGAVDLRIVLRAATKVARGLLKGRARLVEEYDEVPPARGDPARLEQVFLNLLVNASHAFDANHPNNEVRLRLTSVGADRVRIDVEDNGVGIPTELIDRVFDPFFTTKPAGVGTGLGLPICHSIVSSLGGKISVHSEKGHGTMFTVELPAAREARPQRSITPAPFIVSESTARVLIVDDELPVASLLCRLLSEEFDVQIATSGRDALDILLGDDGFDVVLCDLLMPGMTGMELYRELGTQRPHYQQRLVLMTGGAFTPSAARFLEEVSLQRLQKPFDIEDVQRIVRRAVLRRTTGGTPTS